MTDKELLELVAKVAGYHKIDFLDWELSGRANVYDVAGVHRTWNPLADSDDALQLVALLGLSVLPYPIYKPGKHSVQVKQYRMSDLMREANPSVTMELFKDDPVAAIRRAIVISAAQIELEKANVKRFE